MTEILLVVEDPLHVAGRVHVKVVNGGVPPLGLAVQVNGLPSVPPVEQFTLFVGFPAPTAGIVTRITTLCESEPLVPVTLTGYTPAGSRAPASTVNMTDAVPPLVN